MPIDVQAPYSPGWWMHRLFNRLGYQYRQTRLWRLHNYRIGRAPLPVGAQNAREAFEAFCRTARSNFAELVIAAMSERITVNGFRTSLETHESGDARVGEFWEQTGLDVISADVTDAALSLSESYVIVGQIDPDTGAPLVTAEDPRWTVGEVDPANPRRLLAALKVLHDDSVGEDRAYLYLPGRATTTRMAEVWVARRRFTVSDTFDPMGPYLYERPGTEFGYGLSGPISPIMSFSPQAWDWDMTRSGALNHPMIPVVRFDNKDSMGEFEAHTDVLDRINHQILQRMMIATLQAFRQRAVQGLPLKDEDGNDIDYTDVFSMDPAALWQLPETAKMWESAQVDLSPILNAVKDDVQHLAAVTRTPMFMLMPSGVNQSAEGATMQREALVFKVSDRIARFSHPWAQVMSLVLRQMGLTAQADLATLRTMWRSPERLSLAEKSDAAIKATNDIPRRSRLIHIWGFQPAEADRMMSEWAADVVLDAQIAAAAAIAAADVAPPTRGTAHGGAPGGKQAASEGAAITGTQGEPPATPPGVPDIPTAKVPAVKPPPTPTSGSVA